MFPCTKCGACCRAAGTVAGFPEPTLAGGQCAHLLSNLTCGIYDRRPDMCKVDHAFDTGGTGYPDRNAWYEANKRACNNLQRRYHLPVVTNWPP